MSSMLNSVLLAWMLTVCVCESSAGSNRGRLSQEMTELLTATTSLTNTVADFRRKQEDHVRRIQALEDYQATHTNSISQITDDVETVVYNVQELASTESTTKSLVSSLGEARKALDNSYETLAAINNKNSETISTLDELTNQPDVLINRMEQTKTHTIEQLTSLDESIAANWKLCQDNEAKLNSERTNLASVGVTVNNAIGQADTTQSDLQDRLANIQQTAEDAKEAAQSNAEVIDYLRQTCDAIPQIENAILYDAADEKLDPNTIFLTNSNKRLAYRCNTDNYYKNCATRDNYSNPPITSSCDPATGQWSTPNIECHLFYMAPQAGIQLVNAPCGMPIGMTISFVGRKTAAYSTIVAFNLYTTENHLAYHLSCRSWETVANTKRTDRYWGREIRWSGLVLLPNSNYFKLDIERTHYGIRTWYNGYHLTYLDVDAYSSERGLGSSFDVSKFEFTRGLEAYSVTYYYAW